MTKKFILMTSGRSGSTSLMDYLETFDDIALPNKDLECRDNEILNPLHVKRHKSEYSKLCGLKISSNNELIDNFFAYHSDSAFTGFKSMPNRHKNDFYSFVQRKDIKFIALIREDIPSTVASFILAIRTNSWRRTGEKVNVQWKFQQQDVPQVLNHLLYIYQSYQVVKKIKGAIHITYEQLCEPDFNSPELNDFFGRNIKIANPKPPTVASDYVVNWDTYKNFIEENIDRINKKISFA